MTRASAARIARAVAIAAAMFTATGCASSFYLSESETRAYLENLRTESTANTMLENFRGQVIRLEFTSATPTPRIRSTNILTVLRAIPQLIFLEQGLQQINLERLSTQLERQLDAWISERLYFLLQQGGGRVRLEQLDRVIVRILSPPTLAYDAARQAAAFDLTVRVDLYGTLEVSGLLSDGHHRLQVTIDNYRLRGALRVPPASPADALVQLAVEPQPGTVSVAGNVSDNVKSRLRGVLAQQLASPVNESRLLTFDNFALFGVELVRTAAGPRLEAGYRPRPEVAEAILDMAVRGSGGTLHHARRRNGAWSAPVAIPLGGTIDGDAALVASGSDQLELVAVGGAGELVYSGWRSGAWGTVFRTSTAPGATQFAAARPALVATATGQLEVVAPGIDGRLYHVRRVNGQWSAPSVIANPGRVATPPLRDPTAVHVGNKIVLLYGDGRNRIFAAAFDLEIAIWGQSFELPSQGTPFPVAAAACRDGRVDVVHVRADGTVAHGELDIQSVNFTPPLATTGISHYPETVIGGRLAAGPTLTCSGYRRMELMGRGADNRLWHNHYSISPVGLVDGRTIGAGWQGWTQVSDRLFGSLASQHIRGPIAAAATRAGEVHLAVLEGAPPPRSGSGPTPVGPELILYNNYDSSRFGYSPWRAVHWRGLERVATTSFIGHPALAIWGRQLEIAAVGNDGNIWHSRLADTGLADFRGMSGTAVRFPFEPVVLSSGPGIVDILYPSATGGPRHMRRLNGFPSSHMTLGVPSGVRFASPVTAVSFGVGHIELVAAAQNGTLHHWRYRRGAWEAPRTIAGGPIISAPVLVNVGAGQLELLGIGQDQRLHHWRFVNGQWTAPQQLGGSSALSAVLFGPLAVASTGDGTVDVVVVEDGTFRLLHRRVFADEALSVGPFLRLGPRGSFMAIGGNVTDVPSVTAFSAHRLLVVVPGTDGQLYGNWSELVPPSRPPDFTVRPIGDLGLRWRGFEVLSMPGLMMGGAARLRDEDLALVTVDRTGRIYHARYNAGRWSGFWMLQRQTSDVQRQPATRPALTAH